MSDNSQPPPPPPSPPSLPTSSSSSNDNNITTTTTNTGAASAAAAVKDDPLGGGGGGGLMMSASSSSSSLSSPKPPPTTAVESVSVKENSNFNNNNNKVNPIVNVDASPPQPPQPPQPSPSISSSPVTAVEESVPPVKDNTTTTNNNNNMMINPIENEKQQKNYILAMELKSDDSVKDAIYSKDSELAIKSSDLPPSCTSVVPGEARMLPPTNVVEVTMMIDQTASSVAQPSLTDAASSGSNLNVGQSSSSMLALGPASSSTTFISAPSTTDASGLRPDPIFSQQQETKQGDTVVCKSDQSTSQLLVRVDSSALYKAELEKINAPLNKAGSTSGGGSGETTTNGPTETLVLIDGKVDSPDTTIAKKRGSKSKSKSKKNPKFKSESVSIRTAKSKSDPTMVDQPPTTMETAKSDDQLPDASSTAVIGGSNQPREYHLVDDNDVGGSIETIIDQGNKKDGDIGAPPSPFWVPLVTKEVMEQNLATILTKRDQAIQIYDEFEMSTGGGSGSGAISSPGGGGFTYNRHHKLFSNKRNAFFLGRYGNKMAVVKRITCSRLEKEPAQMDPIWVSIVKRLLAQQTQLQMELCGSGTGGGVDGSCCAPLSSKIGDDKDDGSGGGNKSWPYHTTTSISSPSSPSQSSSTSVTNTIGTDGTIGMEKSKVTTPPMMMKTLQHKQEAHLYARPLLEMYEIFYLVPSRQFFIFMQVAPNKSMHYRIKERTPVRIGQARTWMAQLLNGIAFLQNNGICHRNIRLEHLVFDAEHNVRLIGWRRAVPFFNLTTQKPNWITKRERRIRQNNHLPPEAFLTDNYDPGPLDLWSFGVILCALSTFRYPFNVKLRGDAKPPSEVEWQQFKQRHPRSLHPPVERILDRLFVTEPTGRCTLADVMEADFWRPPPPPPPPPPPRPTSMPTPTPTPTSSPSSSSSSSSSSTSIKSSSKREQLIADNQNKAATASMISLSTGRALLAKSCTAILNSSSKSMLYLQKKQSQQQSSTLSLNSRSDKGRKFSSSIIGINTRDENK